MSLYYYMEARNRYLPSSTKIYQTFFRLVKLDQTQVRSVRDFRFGFSVHGRSFSQMVQSGAKWCKVVQFGATQWKTLRTWNGDSLGI